MNELLTVREAAAMYQLHQETVRAWVRKGVVPHLRIGPYRLIRLRRSDLERVVRPGDC